MSTLHQIEGDAFAALARMPACWAHGCVTDPPYGWSFMGRDFDRQHKSGAFDALLDRQATFAGWLTSAERRERHVRPFTEAERYALWSLAWIREVYRVLVPGGMLMAFQGSKSYDLTVAAARLAGFEVLPMLVGITGQAMAQGGDVGKLIDREAGATREVVGMSETKRGKAAFGGGHKVGRDPITAPATPLAHDFKSRGTRLRDQAMPVAVLMKPTEGSFAANARRWGVAGFDVDGCRVETDQPRQARARTDPERRVSIATYRDVSGMSIGTTTCGRYPGNVVLDAAAAEEVGEMSGWSVTRSSANGQPMRHGNWEGSTGFKVKSPNPHDDHGTAARYFRRFNYISRAPRSERRRGLETWHWVGSKDHPEGWRRVDVEEWQTIPKRRQMIGSNHPTLKSLEFTTWVARLILPPMGPEASRIRMETTGSRARLLVPFSGVGSECIGGGLAGWEDIVACETSGSYVAQTACRWAAWGPYSSERAAEVERTGDVRATHAQRGLFEVSP